jgi:hypothetical protein
MWIPVSGFEQYVINKIGQIKRISSGKILKINYATTYPSVSLSVDNKKSLGLIHRMLAIAFIPNPDNKPQVNHKNGNKKDFSLDNLEWSTSSENCQHAYDTGLAIVSEKCKYVLSKTHSGANHYNSKKVYHIKTNEVYDTIRSAAKASSIPVQTLHRHLHRPDNKTDLRFINN